MTDHSSEARPWLAHYDAQVPVSIPYADTTLDGLLRATAARHGGRPALHFFGASMSYRALDREVDRFAAGLRLLGVEPGERVVVFMPNCPQAVIAYHAVWRLGGVAVPVNPLYTATELSRQVTDAEAAVVVTLSVLRDRVSADLPGVRHVVVGSISDYFPWWLRVAFRFTRAGRRHRLRRTLMDERTVTFGSLVASARPEPSVVEPDGVAVLFYTGGTTGIPKGAILTHRNLVANATQVSAWSTGLDEGDEVMMTALPLAHSYGMTVCMSLAVFQGWAQVLVPDPRDLPRLLSLIDRHRVTVLPGVPTLYAAIAQHPRVREGTVDLSSVEVCISGAAGLPAEVQSEFERVTGGRLVEGYGLTEASPVTHANPIGSGGRIGTIGLPLPDTDCKIVDVGSETVPVASGQPGILCISGPQVMEGYWRRPEETAQTLRHDREGRAWLHTGDVATMDDDGYFRIIDRQKDMILAAGGFNVYPREIEDELYEHPKVLQAAAIGVPVGAVDQRVKAYVVLKPDEQATDEELIAFLRERLAVYKVPRAIEFRDELPMAFTGKVLRRLLAEEEKGAE